MDTYNVSSELPQDLLLIRDLVGEDNNSTPASFGAALSHDQFLINSSSDEGTDSEEEVEANLLSTGNNPNESPETLPASESESDDSSISSDSGSEPEINRAKIVQAIKDEDEEAPTLGHAAYMTTENGVVEDEVAIPDILQLDPSEPLEKIGEIFSILNDKMVIVKGTASKCIDRGSDKALDSDTLLVFEDRKVLGFIYETFGPTHEPLYQVRFNEKFPLDLDRARVSCPIFHVPNRSNFVFVNQLQQQKGSDASNAHDEEPAEDEVEFSDDDQEAAYKRSKRIAKSQSHESSMRQRPPHRRDHDFFDDSLGSHNPYDEHGPYDADYSAGPSRPLPIPYDDPYADPYSEVPTGEEPLPYATVPTAIDSTSHHDFSGSPSDRLVDQDRHPTFGSRPPRGRGRGRDRQMSDRGRRRGRGRGRNSSGTGSQHGTRDIRSPQGGTSFVSPHQNSLSNDAISNYPDQSSNFPLFAQPAPVSSWTPPSAFPQQNIDFGLQNQYGNVQPHINPRFATQWGFNFSQPEAQYGSHTGSAQWQRGQEEDMEQNGT